MTNREERIVSTALMLSGIWMLARLISHRDVRTAREWREHAISHLDVIGQQTDAARAYRRETTFPEIKDQ